MQINQPVTITWSTSGAAVTAQTIDISDVAYGIQLLPEQRSYTYTPVKPGEPHVRINASSGCDYVAAETKFHVQNCPVDSTRTMTLSATQVLPGATVTAQVAIDSHESVRWVVSGGTLVSTLGGSATITAGAPGTLTVDAYISKNGTCEARVTGSVQVVCPDLTRDMILQDANAQAGGSFYAIVPEASNESVRWEVTGGAITATWLTPVGDGVGAAVGIAVGGPGTLTIDAFVTRDGACETKIERIVNIICVDVSWRGGVTVGDDPVKSGAALNATINGDPAIDTFRWEVTNGTITSTDHQFAVITAGAPGTMTITVTVSRNGCDFRYSRNVTVCPDLTRDMILQNPTAQAYGSLYAIVAKASNESVRWEVTGGTITAQWLTPVGDGVGAAINIAVGGPGTLTIDAYVSRDGSCETKIERVVDILCVDVPWRGGVIVGSDPLNSSAAMVAAINGDPAIDTFRWEVTNGTITSTDHQFAYITAGAPGTMTITAIVGHNGCEFRYSRNVTVVCPVDDPTIGLFWNGSNTHSPGTTFTAYSNAPAGYTTTWTITNGSLSTATGTSTDVTLGTSGITIIHMTVTNPYGCVVAQRAGFFLVF